MDNNQLPDNRQFDRLPISGKVSAKIVSKSPLSKQFFGTAKNLGPSGLLFSSSRNISPGTVLDLEIILPTTGKSFNVRGEARWSIDLAQRSKNKAFDTGIKFLQIDQDVFHLLLDYVCTHIGKNETQP